MFPFISPAIAAPGDYVDLIVPYATQFSIAISILVAAIVSAIAAIRAALSADKSIKASEHNRQRLDEIEATVKQASADVQKQAETLSSDTRKSMQERQENSSKGS